MKTTNNSKHTKVICFDTEIFMRTEDLEKDTFSLERMTFVFSNTVLYDELMVISCSCVISEPAI